MYTAQAVQRSLKCCFELRDEDTRHDQSGTDETGYAEAFTHEDHAHQGGGDR